LGAELDWRNYRTTRDERSGQVTIEFRYPAELQHDIAQYERATLPSIQTLLLPSQCERILLGPEMLTTEQADKLATALDFESSNDHSDEDTKRHARIAIASTLVAKAPDWLNLNPDVYQYVHEIIRSVVASIGESADSLLRPFSLEGSGRDLQFAAHAVMHQWMAAAENAKEWEPSVLRILTSRDGPAIETLMCIATANRSRLGSKWWRLLQLALLWSGLSILAPGFDDSTSIETRWVRWLRWLRARSVEHEDTSAESINPLAIARRVERLQRARWRRDYARSKGRFRRSPEERRSSGLDTYLLGHIFAWLTRDPSGGTPVPDAAYENQDRKLAQALWAFEAWRRYEDIDDDGEHGAPSHFGYDVLSVLARMVLSAPPKESTDLWRPVFSLGADAHYSIGHFISCWFVQASSDCDGAAFARHWRGMLMYALEESNWSTGRRWYYGERLLRQLLGFGLENAINRVPNFQTMIFQLRDLYEVWARGHLHRDEDNVAGFCGFLASDAGAPLRLDGLQWLVAALHYETRAAHWHRERTGNALTELLDLILSEDAKKVSESAKAREALVRLAADLVARQVPAALALQEQIQQMR
ncbi:MAG: hypothetical protein WD014_03470, partial [Dongiaceae bacterium]